ncbi:MAG: hypothetical protein HYZ20_19600 [Burkholderiales bacterium]|nr:hypothetical protein [Burkholderiales bacterium]
MSKKIWLVEHPTFRYVEDVKALARKGGLRIIDAERASNAEREAAVTAAEAPRLTLRPEFAPASKAAKQ